MWSILRSRPLGTVSMRQITLFVLAILMVLFLAITTHTTTVFAQTPTPQAIWSGETIQYEGQSFEKQDPAPNLAGTVCETRKIVYAYFTHQDNDASKPVTQARVICFKDSEADRSKEIPANIVTFPDATSQSGSGPVAYGNRATDATSTNIAPTESGSTSNTADSKNITTCDSKNTHGLGWIICPITNWLADGMDQLYNILSSFLTVTPLSTTKDSTMYYIWNIMRNFANVLFIFGFLIIIYSQITNVGLSSYGIKRLLPRLIIAAVLVNISYWIVAVAVDLSNILGVVIKDMFDQVIESIPKNTKDASMDYKDMSWKSVAGVALSGGTALFGIGSVATAFVASAGGSLWFLLVGLASVLVSALVAILVLAARQALITIFIILSPLAFVAYLLPGTEKYFHRWREFFTTMLLVFPIFAVVFGGARLAGIAIIYSADPKSPNFFNLIILGMIVQIAPVIITPLLIRVSGSLLGRIAGIANNPNKGIIDNTRKFAQNQHDRTKNRRLWNMNDNKKYTSNDPLAWGARRIALRNTHKERQLKTWEQGEEAAYVNDHRYHDVHHQHELNDMTKNTGESKSKAEFNEHMATNELLRRLYYSQEQNREHAEASSKNLSTQWEGLKAAPDIVGVGAAEQKLGREARDISDEAKGLVYREAAAKQIIDKNYHEQLAKNKEMQEFAGFSTVDPYGASRVKNLADENEFKAREARIAASNAAMGRADATIEEMQAVILGDASKAGRFKDFVNDADSRSAAIRRLQQKGPMFAYQQVQEALDLSSQASSVVEKTLRSEMASALGDRKIFYISNTHRNEMLEGKLDPKYLHESGRDLMIKETLDLSGLGAETMVTADRDELKAVLNYLRKYKITSLNANAQKSLRNSIELAFKDDRYSGRMGKSRTELNQIREELGLGRID